MATDPAPEAAAPDVPLNPAVIDLWRASLGLGAGAAAVAAAVLVGLVPAGAPRTVTGIVALAVVLTLLAACVLVPPLRYRRWRYAVREDEVDLVRGVWWRTRTVVPTARVQHVDVRRTPAGDAFGLAEVLIHTAAGTVRVPGLAHATAVEVRERLAALAKVPDEL